MLLLLSCTEKHKVWCEWSEGGSARSGGLLFIGSKGFSVTIGVMLCWHVVLGW